MKCNIYMEGELNVIIPPPEESFFLGIHYYVLSIFKIEGSFYLKNYLVKYIRISFFLLIASKCKFQKSLHYCPKTSFERESIVKDYVLRNIIA